MRKRTVYSVVALFLGTCFAFSQIANESSGKKIIISVEEKRAPKLLPPNSSTNPFIKNNPFTGGVSEKTDSNDKLNSPAGNLNEDEKFLNPGDYYLSKLNRKGKEGENKRYGSSVDQYLGDVRYNGTFVEIIVRDHESPDGDRIRIMLNDEVVVPDIMLYESFRSANVDLIAGFNKIDFVALNQGSSGPNTAEVRIYTTTGELLAANRWNLATGVKATYIVVKE